MRRPRRRFPVDAMTVAWLTLLFVGLILALTLIAGHTWDWSERALNDGSPWCQDVRVTEVFSCSKDACHVRSDRNVLVTITPPAQPGTVRTVCEWHTGN